MTFLEIGVIAVLSYLMLTRTRYYPDAYRNVLNSLGLTISPTEASVKLLRTGYFCFHTSYLEFFH